MDPGRRILASMHFAMRFKFRGYVQYRLGTSVLNKAAY